MAIAYDTTTQGEQTGTSITQSHTCTGSDRLLLVGVTPGEASTSDIITGVTYNGVAMSLIDKQAETSGITVYIFGLVNPASGAHDYVISSSSSVAIKYCGVSYTGVKQTGLPDSVAKGTDADTSITMTTTTVADNCWLASVLSKHRNDSAGANTTRRGISASDNFAFYDSNGAKTPAGSYSLNSTLTGSPPTDTAYVVISFAPYVAPVGPANLKTRNGVVKANIKTINGVPIANVKSLNGVI